MIVRYPNQIQSNAHWHINHARNQNVVSTWQLHSRRRSERKICIESGNAAFRLQNEQRFKWTEVAGIEANFVRILHHSRIDVSPGSIICCRHKCFCVNTIVRIGYRCRSCALSIIYSSMCSEIRIRRVSGSHPEF